MPDRQNGGLDLPTELKYWHSKKLTKTVYIVA